MDLKILQLKHYVNANYSPYFCASLFNWTITKVRCSHKSSSPFKIPHCLFALCSVDVVTSTKWQKRKKAIKLTYKGLLFIFEFWAECQVREREKFRLAGGIAILTFLATQFCIYCWLSRERQGPVFFIFLSFCSLKSIIEVHLVMKVLQPKRSNSSNSTSGQEFTKL